VELSAPERSGAGESGAGKWVGCNVLLGASSHDYHSLLIKLYANLFQTLQPLFFLFANIQSTYSQPTLSMTNKGIPDVRAGAAIAFIKCAIAVSALSFY
jgi:hypothetical protein